MGLASAAVPISSVFTLSTGTLVVTFDRPLIAGTSAANNWWVENLALTWKNPTPAVVAGSTVTATLTSSIGGPVGPWTRYVGAPQDVRGTDSLLVEPFIQFPTTILP